MKSKKLLEILISNFDSSFKKYYKNIVGKKILITGSTGLIGQNFLIFFYLALKSGYLPKEIVLPINKTFPNYLKFLNKEKRIKFKKMDLINKKFDKSKYDIIIHAAGYGQPVKFISNPLKTLLINSSVTLKLLSILKKNGNFLFLSSSEIYSGNNNQYIKENQIGTTSPSHKRACYIEGKRFGETVLNIFRKNNYNVKSARVCLTYGPGTQKNDERILNQLIQRGLCQNKVYINDAGNAKRSYIYISDAIKILLEILFNGKNETYNVGGEEKTSIKILGKKVADLLNKKFKIKETKIGKKIGAPKNAFIDIKLIKSEFNIKRLLNLDYGLRKTIDWQKILYSK